MKYVLLSHDSEVLSAVDGAFQSNDEVVICKTVPEALAACDGAELIFVDLLATLTSPGKIAGYEAFAEAKMGHPIAKGTPLVLIGAPDDYVLDSMVGYPDFVFAHLRRPVTFKTLRRMTTLV